MISKYRATAAAVLASLFLISCPVMGAGDEGSGGGEGDSNEMTYITIGLIVVVGGLFFLDVINSSDDETVPVETVSNQIIETGINWDETFPDDSMMITVAVSVFPGENGSETAMQFINVLNELAGDSITVYDDPLDLGTDSAVDRAIIASGFFGVDYLVFQVEDSETLQYGIASPDLVLWTSTEQSDNSILVVVEELLQSGVF
ncbi:MAG: hypothetical protein KAT09_05770 [Candidatus Aegiribacteria sp.]|nr:hypothetical protein [Candidatus Aegiribacteria sp.]